MKIEVRGFDIYISFTDEDFLRRLEGGKEAWRGAIEEIKQQFPFPEGRYDGESKRWMIRNSPANRAAVTAIKKEYFQDKNQMELL